MQNNHLKICFWVIIALGVAVVLAKVWIQYDLRRHQESAISQIKEEREKQLTIMKHILEKKNGE